MHACPPSSRRARLLRGVRPAPPPEHSQCVYAPTPTTLAEAMSSSVDHIIGCQHAFALSLLAMYGAQRGIALLHGSVRKKQRITRDVNRSLAALHGLGAKPTAPPTLANLT